MVVTYYRAFGIQKVLLLSACCSLWQSLHLASASTSSAEAVACPTDAEPLGSCSRGNSLLQKAVKPSRTVASIQDFGSRLDEKRTSIKDDASVGKQATKYAHLVTSIPDFASWMSRTSTKDNAFVGKKVIPQVADANVTSATPVGSAAMLQATQAMWRSLEMVYQTRAVMGISLVVLLCCLCLCMVCIVLRLKNASHRRDLVGQGRGQLSATFGQMPAQPAGRLLQRQTQPSASSNRPGSGQNIGYRGGQSQPQLTTGAASSSKTLCPGLVVPESSDCVLVVRVLPRLQSVEADFGDAAAGRGAIENQIFDLTGRAVLSTSVVQPWPKQGMAVVTLHSLHTLRTADSGWLSLCRTGQDSKSVSIYDKDDSLFGSLKRDGPRYVLSGISGSDGSLFFEGTFEEHRVSILDARRNMIAHAEPCRMEFEPDGSFYQARVAAGVDVGVVLSALLSIDAMEGAPGVLMSALQAAH